MEDNRTGSPQCVLYVNTNSKQEMKIIVYEGEW